MQGGLENVPWSWQTFLLMDLHTPIPLYYSWLILKLNDIPLFRKPEEKCFWRLLNLFKVNKKNKKKKCLTHLKSFIIALCNRSLRGYFDLQMLRTVVGRIVFTSLYVKVSDPGVILVQFFQITCLRSNIVLDIFSPSSIHY